MKYICWKGEPNYLHNALFESFCNNAGFFPMEKSQNLLMRYLDLCIQDMQLVDVLGSWRYNEKVFSKQLKNSIKVDRELMTPLLTQYPWTYGLKGKKVLVVHPFSETIMSQYKKRKLLFPNSEILPEFSLEVIKAVQSQAYEDTPFANWFDALKFMEQEIDSHNYDICLLGCGAYGFNLAAHCKRRGKKAIHLGGILQMLFGIKGKRWETEDTYKKLYPYTQYYNEHWVRPSREETPKNAGNVENSCYW